LIWRKGLTIRFTVARFIVPSEEIPDFEGPRPFPRHRHERYPPSRSPSPEPAGAKKEELVKPETFIVVAKGSSELTLFEVADYELFAGF
jgi:hypothetical protein